VRRCVLVLAVVAVLGLITLSPPASAATVEAPDGEPCLVLAFTDDGRGLHYSMLGDGTVQFGTELWVESDCPGGFNLTVGGGIHLVSEGGPILVNVPLTTRTVVVEGEGWNLTYENLQFYPTGTYGEVMEAYGDQPIPAGDYWTLGDLRSHEVWVALVSIVLTWLGTIAVLHRVARWWVERRLVEEVV